MNFLFLDSDGPRSIRVFIFLILFVLLEYPVVDKELGSIRGYFGLKYEEN